MDKMPTVGETVLGNSFGTSFGGKGANQAVMAAKVPPSHTRTTTHPHTHICPCDELTARWTALAGW